MHHIVINIAGMTFNADTLITMWIAMGFIILVAFLMTRKLSLYPSKLQLVGEKILTFIWGMTDSIIGKEGRQHVPFVASLFLFIVIANLSGQLPWKLLELFGFKEGELASPTNDINVTAALAILVLIYYLVAGIKKKGIGVIVHLVNFKELKGCSFSDKIIELFKAIILTLVELLEMVTRPLSLALRLFANIFAGEMLLIVALSLMPLGGPVLVMFFELLVAFIQAFVFMMLTMAYISSATSEGH